MQRNETTTPEDSESDGFEADLKALVKRVHIDHGVKTESAVGAKTTAALTLIGVVDGPKAFKGAEIAATIESSAESIETIMDTSLRGLPKRLQKHLIDSEYKYFGIIHWIAGPARENPPADYDTLFMQSTVEAATFEEFRKTLAAAGISATCRQYLNVRAVGLQSNKFIKHDQLSVGITGIGLSVQYDFHGISQGQNGSDS